MFHSDKPIDKNEYYCINRTQFSKQLAKAILVYSSTDNFTLCLCGKWGSGKTSILNMVIEEIAAISKNNMEDEKPIIIRFDPWNYSDCSQLISQFFAVMQSKFKTEKGNKALEEIGEVLADYSKLLDIIDTVIPMKN